MDFHKISVEVTENDVWGFYNSRSNPKRMFYLTMALEL